MRIFLDLFPLPIFRCCKRSRNSHIHSHIHSHETHISILSKLTNTFSHTVYILAMTRAPPGHTLMQRMATRSRMLLNRHRRPWWRGHSLLNYEPATVVKIMLLWIRGTMTFEDIGDEVGRSAATCCRYVRRTLKQGGIDFRSTSHGGRRHELFGVRGRYLLCALVHRFRSLSYEKYAWWLSRALEATVSASAVAQQLAALGITRKELEQLYEE